MPDALPGYDMKRAMQHLRRRLALIVICIAAGIGTALIVSVVHKPTFTAAALLSVNQTEDDGTGRGGDASVDTQIAMLQSPAFIERAFAILSRDERMAKLLHRPEDLERSLKVSQVMRSRLVSIAFSAKSPEAAAEIANRIARMYVEDPLLQGLQSIDDASETLVERIAALESELARVQAEGQTAQPNSPANSQEGGSARVSDLRERIATLKVSLSLARRSQETRQQTLALSPPVQLIALASPPARPSSIRSILIVIPAILFSAIFGLALALFLGALDKRIYLPSDLSESFGSPSVAGIPVRRRGRGAGVRRAASAGYLRSIEAVVTATLLMRKTQGAVLLIAASEANAETFDFALAFASAAARVRRTLLIDFGPARPQRRSLGSREVERELGAFDVLAGFLAARDAVQTLPGTRLDFLPSGRDYSGDTVPLLASGRLEPLLSELRAIYDWILIVGPPVVGGNDARLIAKAADNAILVTRASVSSFPEVAAAYRDLSSSLALDGRSGVSPRIFAVLLDAPSRSLPALFRDKRAAKRRTPPIESPIRSMRAPSDETEKDSAPRWRWTDAVARLVLSRGS